MYKYLILIILIGCSSNNLRKKWGGFRSPVSGESNSIGYYSAGCLQGAKTLSLNTPGIIQMRPSRQKYYGHPKLLSFLKKLGKDFYLKQKRYLLVGDLSQPRGGPTLNGHASHQTGLDVDIWFDFVSKREELKYSDLEHLEANKWVSDNEIVQWTSDHDKLILLSIMDERVDRVFVSPPIKKYYCSKKIDEKYLLKIRPWWGHKDHVHIRLKCPSEDKLCLNQEKINTNGCDSSLDWWFTDEAKKVFVEKQNQNTEINLPSECLKVEEYQDVKGYKI